MSLGDQNGTSDNPPRREDVTGNNLPRSMTTAQILREVDRLREIQDERLASAKQTIQAQLDGMSKALELTQSYPTLLDKALESLADQHMARVDALKDLYNEKFASVGRQSADRDERFKMAIASVVEAVTKSEAATTKLLDKIAEATELSNTATNDKISALNDRMNRNDGKSTGMANVWGIIVGGAGLVVALIGIFAFLSSRGQVDVAPAAAVPVIIQVPAPEVIVEPAPLGTLR